jgi:hypothetical protein
VLSHFWPVGLALNRTVRIANHEAYRRTPQNFTGGWQTLNQASNSYAGAASNANGSILSTSIFFGGLLYSSNAG